MATLTEMQDIAPDYLRSKGPQWHHKGTVTDATSSPVRVPPGVSGLMVGVDVGTNATVHLTVSSYADIEADTAVWHAWADGQVTADTIAAVDGRVTALRIVSTGASTWDISAS